MSSSSNISAGGGMDKRKLDRISTSRRSNRLEDTGYLKGLYNWKYVSHDWDNVSRILFYMVEIMEINVLSLI